jgi:hypothetical protein
MIWPGQIPVYSLFARCLSLEPAPAQSPNTQYVTVSELRLQELCDLWEEPCEDAQVIPNGIDPSHFLKLSPMVREIVRRYHVFDRGLVLLLPVRITRRKTSNSA